ncbi:MAG TPA: DUF2231 domain-containing protein [Candidatus Limnocylindrales bacterium]|nr:DUF2231 domain-containing protein [Candidatus Limnocylindrales bacterium]
MAKLTFAENPVHPVLNDYPAVLMPFSLMCDALYVVTRRPTLRNASLLAQLAALGTGAAAAATGYADYETIPEGTDAKRLANVHAALNAGAMGAVALGVIVRLPGRVRPLAVALNVLANATLVVAGWYGSHLVYRHGVRVRGVDPTTGMASPTEDPGKPIADQLERLAGQVPARDLGALVSGTAESAADGSDDGSADEPPVADPTGRRTEPVTVAATATNIAPE